MQDTHAKRPWLSLSTDSKPYRDSGTLAMKRP
jgi:hypothetical protein